MNNNNDDDSISTTHYPFQIKKDINQNITPEISDNQTFFKPYDKIFLLNIGVDDHEHEYTLTNSKDVENNTILIGKMDVSIENKTLTNKFATKDKILNELKDINSTIKETERTLMIIYLSGHGFVKKNPKDQREDFYFCTYGYENANLKETLQINQLANSMNEMKFQHVLIILDCCNTKEIKLDNPQVNIKSKIENFLSKGIWMIASGEGKQKLIEENQRGIFSIFFWKFLIEMNTSFDITQIVNFVHQKTKHFDDYIVRYDTISDKKNNIGIPFLFHPNKSSILSYKTEIDYWTRRMKSIFKTKNERRDPLLPSSNEEAMNIGDHDDDDMYLLSIKKVLEETYLIDTNICDFQIENHERVEIDLKNVWFDNKSPCFHGDFAKNEDPFHKRLFNLFYRNDLWKENGFEIMINIDALNFNIKHLLNDLSKMIKLNSAFDLDIQKLNIVLEKLMNDKKIIWVFNGIHKSNIHLIKDLNLSNTIIITASTINNQGYLSLTQEFNHFFVLGLKKESILHFTSHYFENKEQKYQKMLIINKLVEFPGFSSILLKTILLGKICSIINENYPLLIEKTEYEKSVCILSEFINKSISEIFTPNNNQIPKKMLRNLELSKNFFYHILSLIAFHFYLKKTNSLEISPNETTRLIKNFTNSPSLFNLFDEHQQQNQEEYNHSIIGDNQDVVYKYELIEKCLEKCELLKMENGNFFFRNDLIKQYLCSFFMSDLICHSTNTLANNDFDKWIKSKKLHSLIETDKIIILFYLGQFKNLRRKTDLLLPFKHYANHFMNWKYNLEIFKKFSCEKSIFKYKDENDQTLLHLFCKNENHSRDLLQTLIDNKCDVNSKDSQNNTPLIYLCKNENITPNILNLFMEIVNIDLNEKDINDKTALHHLCENPKNTRELLMILIKEENCLITKDKYGYLPIHYLSGNLSSTNEILDIFSPKIKDYKIYDNCYFFGVGNTEYQEVNKLRGCVNDVIEISNTFKNFGFHTNSFQNLTKESFQLELEKFTENIKNDNIKSKERKLIIFYYSGHGNKKTSEEQKEQENENFYICPIDFIINSTSFAIEFDYLVDKLNIENSHCLIVLDCCFSGGIFKTQTEFEPLPLITNSSFDCIWALTAGGNEEVKEKETKNGSHRGVFSQYFQQALESNKWDLLNEKFLNKNKTRREKPSMIDLNSLVKMIKNRLAKNSELKHIPLHAPLQNSHGIPIFAKRKEDYTIFLSEIELEREMSNIQILKTKISKSKDSPLF